jgi:ABC-type antimicrobial peptide transport system permease subunit
LLKVLGVKRRDLVLSVFTEFFLLGFIAVSFGLFLSAVLGYFLITDYLEIGFSIPWATFVGTVSGISAMCALIGVIVSIRTFGVKPLEVLREI